MSLSARCTSRAEAQAPAPRLPVKRHPGAVRAIADPDNIKAEFAILVRDLKGRGLGHLLLDKLIRYQRAHGTQPLVGLVLRENDAMHDLARAHGFRTDPCGAGASSVRHVLELQPG